jgi:tRNA-dihydrouridine synthase
VAHIVCELGFDGLDINMGCPAKNVASKGCGAGLIRDPSRARGILQATQQGIADWVSGQSVASLNLPSFLIQRVADMNVQRQGFEHPLSRRSIPVSVKTRIGYDEVVVNQWISHLLEEKPVAISIHGRTLKQMYRGMADWGAISSAVKLARGTGTLILGNGDLGSMEDVYKRVKETGVDGVLIGRSALGNPWIFRNKKEVKQAIRLDCPNLIQPVSIELHERFRILKEHVHLYEKLKRPWRFVGMRKHMGWYSKGFYKASDLRVQLLQTHHAQEVEEVLERFITDVLGKNYIKGSPPVPSETSGGIKQSLSFQCG